MAVETKKAVLGYMPEDIPPVGAMLSLGFQQVLTMFPATVLVAILTKFDVGVTLLASGLGTIIALLVTRRRIPMYYGSSFSYISVIITVMALYAPECFNDPNKFYCPEGVRLAQVGIIGTAVLEILIGLLIMRIGKAALDKVLPPSSRARSPSSSASRLPGRGAEHGLGQLAGRFHYADRHRRVLGLPAGQGAARHAADPAGRHRAATWSPSRSA